MRYFLCMLLLAATGAGAQPLHSTADSIRRAFRIPELAYAVVSSEGVLESGIVGTQRAGTSYAAQPGDRFHLGSNTKAITAFIAAQLVREGKIRWESRFMELFPELEPGSRKVYHGITLRQLLSFRAGLPAYTYTFPQPREKDIRGTAAEQRYAMARYFLSRPPMQAADGLTPSNADYILAGMMLEKAAGKPYKELVQDLGTALGIDFGFDYPNLSDSLQPWGHDTALRPLPPHQSVKLNWLLAAGNINVSLPGYCRFICLLLRGLQGADSLLPAAEYNQLLFGMPRFAFGWFNEREPGSGHQVAHNEGNAGAFVTEVRIIKEADRACIVFTNSAHAGTRDGIALLIRAAEQGYGR